MEDVVDAGHGIPDGLRVAHVANVELDLAGILRVVGLQLVAHVVLLLLIAGEDADLADVGGQEMLEHCMPEAARAAGDEKSLILKNAVCHDGLLIFDRARAQFTFIILFILAQNSPLEKGMGLEIAAFCGIIAKKSQQNAFYKEDTPMRAYERLLKYVKVHTTSDPNSGTHPSTLRQFDLAKILVEELKELGLTDAHVDEHCYVYATHARHPRLEDKPALGLIAHMDTAPDASGENVRPQSARELRRRGCHAARHRHGDGGPTFPFLADLKGQTLITTDGTTLLGADDKAGVAEILTALERIIAENRPHGKLCIAFTPDEEIGEGASLFDVEDFGAAYAYTVDGEDVGEISYENFNAAAAVVTVHGFSVHPGSAKNSMINAQNVAMEFHAALPAFSAPSTPRAVRASST